MFKILGNLLYITSLKFAEPLFLCYFRKVFRMSSSEDEEDSSELLLDMQVRHQRKLLAAIDSHNSAVVHDLVHNEGLSPNFTQDGKNPICQAAYFGYVDILDILIEGGCDIHMPNGQDQMWHRQALHIAACKGHLNFVKRLLSYGADVNSRDDDQRTALHWSATYGKSEMVDYLISQGADVNVAQVDGFTPLHAATCLGHDHVCKLLLANGAEINRTDRDGWSAFHTSVCYGHISVVKTLLDAGASLIQQTNDEENVMHIAASSGRLVAAKLLLAKGAKLNEVNRSGYTPFYLAVYYNEYEMAKFLSEVGANIYIPRIPKQTPFYLAAMRGLRHFILLFIEAGYNLSVESWLLRKDFPVELAKLPEVCNFLFHFARNPPTLRDQCRLQIRSLLGFGDLCNTNVDLLDLPSSLKEYVSYRSFK